MELKLSNSREYRHQKRGLNRTFYEIETQTITTTIKNIRCLNRTFYGIETFFFAKCSRGSSVLIVPFMELKLERRREQDARTLSLNRTFYGIETCLPGRVELREDVLIVPFMELKPYITITLSTG